MQAKRNTNLTPALFILFVTFIGCDNQSNKSQSETSKTETKNKKDMETNNLVEFGKKYAQAWCSQKPDSVAAYFSFQFLKSQTVIY